MLYGPAPTPEHQAAHNCGNGHLGCCNPNHLRWDTPAGNQMDRVKHGTSNRGERAWKAKLTEPQVREILKLRGKKSLAELGKMFGVHKSTTGAIHAKISWGWLQL